MLFILVALGGILVMAALGFLLGLVDHNPASARPVTGQGSSELTTSTRVQIPGRDQDPSDEKPTDGSSGQLTGGSVQPTDGSNNLPNVQPAVGSDTDSNGIGDDEPTGGSGDQPTDGEEEPVGDDDDGQRSGFTLAVTEVQGLFPGDRRPIRVRFTNHHSFDIWVTQVATTVRGTPGCAAEHLVTGAHSLRTRVHVPARSRAAGRVPFGMRPSAPNACQGASFDIQLSATAVKK